MAKQLVKYAKTHAEIFIPTIGTLKTTLPPDNKNLKEFVMSRTELGGILIECLGINGRPERAEIPAGNVSFMVLGSLVEDAKAVAKK